MLYKKKYQSDIRNGNSFGIVLRTRCSIILCRLCLPEIRFTRPRTAKLVFNRYCTIYHFPV